MSAYAQEGGSPGGSVYAQKGAVVLGPPAPSRTNLLTHPPPAPALPTKPAPNLLTKPPPAPALPQSKTAPAPAAAPPPVKIVKVRAHTRAVPVKAAPPVKPAAPASAAPVKTAARAVTLPSVQPVDRSTVKRFVPNFTAEPVAGHVPFLQNPDKSWVAPGGKFQSGAHIALRPYYTNTFTLHAKAGPGGDEGTQLNAAQVAQAKKIQVANYGKPGYIARSLIPGGLDEGGTTSVTKAIKRGAEAASTVLPGGGVGEAAGILGWGLKGLKGLRAGKDVAEAAPVAGALTKGVTAGTSAAPDPVQIAKAIRASPGKSVKPATVELVDGSHHAVNPLNPVSMDGKTIHLLSGNSAHISLVRAVHAGDGTEMYRAGAAPAAAAKAAPVAAVAPKVAESVAPHVSHGQDFVGSVPDKAREPGYLYHRAPAASFGKIRETGLHPSKPAGPNPAGVYFANEPIQAQGLSWKRGGVHFRVDPKNVSDLTERAFGESVTPHAVPAKHVEYLGKDGAWHPLAGGGAPAAAHTTEEAAAVRGALKGAPNVRAAQAGDFSAQRRARFAKTDSIFRDTSLPVDERQAYGMSALKGSLDRPVFTGFKKMTPETVTNIKAQIMEHPTLRTGQKVKLLTSLDRGVAGIVPTAGEHKLFTQVFGKETALGIAQAAKTGRWKNIVANVINVPRTIQSTLDMSSFLRQGAVALARHPVITGGNFKTLVHSFASEGAALKVESDIASHPNYPLMRAAKLALTGSGDLQPQEEQFGANMLENLGGGKNPIRWSSRSYSAFLNKTRADIFNHLLDVAHGQGHNIHDEKFLSDLGGMVNVFTGRGKLPGDWERAAKVFNGLFFSPRLMSSRLHMIGQPFNPTLNPFVRRQYQRAAAQGFGALLTVLGLAKASGLNVGVDPTNADFGKIKFGNTRVDLGAGFLQYAHLTGQLALGKSTSSTTGKVSHIYSGKAFQRSAHDVVSQFFEGKLSPPWAVVNDALRQQTNFGKFSIWHELINRMTPLSSQDIYGVATNRSKGPLGAAEVAGAGILSTLGGGIQTYGPQAPKTKLPLAPAQGPTSGSIYAGKGSSYAGSSYAGSGSSYAGK